MVSLRAVIKRPQRLLLTTAGKSATMNKSSLVLDMALALFGDFRLV